MPRRLWSRGRACRASQGEERGQDLSRRIPFGARARAHRRDALDRADRDRCDDPRDGGAVDRRRHRRVRPVPVAVLDLPARPGRLGAGVLEARRHHRAQADHARRHRAVPHRLDPLRVRVGHDLAHRLPRGAGPRRRRRAARVDHDHRRHLLGARARPGAGLHRERVGGVVGRRPDPRRPVRRVRLVAVDLLREHPALPHRRVHAAAQLPRVGRAREAPHRLRRGLGAHRRPHAA